VRPKGEPPVIDVSALRMREATIATGIWLTLVVGGLGGVYTALTWEQPHRLTLLALFAVAMASGPLVWLLPRERIVRSGWREPFFLSWTLLDLALLVTGSLADGGTDSPLALVFFLPVVFSSMSYPLASVITVGAASVISYLGVALVAGGSSTAQQVGFVAALGCTGAMSAWQAQNHKRQHRALSTVSRTDPLTGCLNRRGFEERSAAELGAMQRRGRSGAMVVLDIDHFKPVNDIFGHAAGDELLCWVVRTLERVVRPGDAVGRLGGDEFAVLLPEIDADDAREVAGRIGEALRERAPASLGVAHFPHDGPSLDELTRKADGELYASRLGRYGGGGAADAEPQAGGVAEGDAPTGASATRPAAARPGAIDLWRAAMDAMPQRDGGHGLDGDGDENTLLDQIDASVIVTDMAGIVISWNRAAEALYGWTTGQAIGRSARELVVPEDPAAAERLVVELLRDGRWDGELQVRRKDRSLFSAYVRNRLIRDQRGKPEAIVGVAVDISSRVAAETALAESRNYALAVTESMGEGLLTLDVDGRVTYVNRTAQEMLGWDEGALRGQSICAALLPLRGDGSVVPFADCAIARVLSEEETVRVEDELLRTRSGRAIPVAYTAAPFRTHDGVDGCVVIFTDIADRRRREADQRRDADRLAVLDRVERGLAEERFVLHAQPIVDLLSGETVQHELLLRMRETDGRLVPPGEFLPVAEQYALIGEIDWWVIKQAAQIAGSGCPVQLNISARSVGDPDVLEHVVRCVQQSRVQPGKLVFEITETAIVEDQSAARTFAEGLHALGCEVALDDFGTGYGTLTYLKQIPVDYLKLDIEFVRDIATNDASRHVVQAVVALARDFGLRTIAEGVEDGGALELLHELGVDFAQGFHVARPAPFAELPGDLAEPVRLPARPLSRSASRRTQPRRAASRALAASGRRRS
jgi:diguanylate cyclase (GGDEF)-like protein/PAS domain S-box-containing protein